MIEQRILLVCIMSDGHFDLINYRKRNSFMHLEKYAAEIHQHDDVV